MEMISRSRSPLKYQVMTQETLGAKLSPLGGHQSIDIISGGVGVGAAPTSSTTTVGVAEEPNLGSSTNSGNAGASFSGSSSNRRSGHGNPGQQEVVAKFTEAGQFIKEQFLPTRQRQGVKDEPLLSASQGSLKEAKAAEAASASSSNDIGFSRGHQKSTPRQPLTNGGGSSGRPPTISYRKSDSGNAGSVTLDLSAPPSHMREEQQPEACYSRELSVSNGDLSSPQPVVSKHSSRYRPMHNDGGVNCGGGLSVVDPDLNSLGLRRSSSSRPGSVITFRKINYEVMVKRFPWSKAEKKVVLNGISGIMRPGLNAIMGPTGSGKSSLLDVLAGRKDPQYLRGEVLVDGAEQPDNFKCMSGYVVQDDIVMGTLTVRENLSFSAALRLPGNTSARARKEKVDGVIKELGLTKVADSKIGTELIRGVSGGERKRTNIGMELITDPPVLFLDEPTTGLDAFTAGSVIRTLKMLANSGRTIIFSIHQPKYSIYRLFDNLTLVVAGSVVYHGRAENDPLDYFARIGFQCEAHNSPPDFFMDMVHGEILSRKGSRENLEDKANNDSIVDTDELKTKSEAISHRLIEAWSQSAQAKCVNEQVDNICLHSLSREGASIEFKGKKVPRVDYPTSVWNQILWVSWRTGLNLFRNPQSSVIQLVVYLFFAISLGTVFFNLDTSLESGIQNRQGLFFFLLLQMVFVNLGAVEVFIKERVIFIHENSSGFYRVSVYFLAKIFCDMLPIKTLPVLLFMPIVYFMAKLKLSAGAFFFYELNLVLTTCGACGVAFFVSASVSVFGIANIFISIIYVFMMVFGGFLMNIGSMGDWLSWCKYLSLFNYAYSGLSANEFVGLEFCPSHNTTNLTRTCKEGYVVLSDQKIAYSTPWDLWSNELGMLLITLFFLTLCYIQLRRINKYK